MLKIKYIFGCFIWIYVYAVLWANTAEAQGATDQTCNIYDIAINDSTIDILPEALLADGETAAKCLMDFLKFMKNVNSPDIVEPMQSRIVKATGALNNIVSGGDATALITFLRKIDSIEAADVLSWGARSSNKSIRLNSTILFANIVDNNSVCVAIDHLYDKRFMSSPYGVNGRANLLAIVSVIAPWSYKENYENIIRLLVNIRPEVGLGEELTGTRGILDKICERLKFQTTYSDPNSRSALPDGLRVCNTYRPSWAPAEAFIYNAAIAAQSPTIEQACPN